MLPAADAPNARFPSPKELPPVVASPGVYARSAALWIPRLLTLVDSDPTSTTYGCLDRQYWHYRTAAFPSAMYQEGAAVLAMLYRYRMPGNWLYGNPRVKQLAQAAAAWAARSAHANGAGDDYYPWEQALGAAVFSLVGCAHACWLLKIRDADTLRGLRRRACWVAAHQETGTLANHHALAALGLFWAGRVLDQPRLCRAARQRIEQLLALQHSEGWFPEYGGADPGYQSLTISVLARLAARSGMDSALLPALRRSVEFLQWFVHPDGSCGGPYASRGTCQLYTAGLELLGDRLPQAAAVAHVARRALSAGQAALPDDERLFIHFFYDRLLSWLFARRRNPRLAEAAPAEQQAGPHASPEAAPAPASAAAATAAPLLAEGMRHFPGAGLVVFRRDGEHLVVSTARGGSLVWFAPGREPVVEGALVVADRPGRIAHSAWHDAGQAAAVRLDSQGLEISLDRPLAWKRQRLATPAKQAAFHLGMITLGRYLRTPVRWLLQQLLITGRRPAPVRLQRKIHYRFGSQPRLVVTDRVELDGRRFVPRGLWTAGAFQPGYVAASCGYEPGTLQPWQNYDHLLPVLRQARRVELTRCYPDQ